MIITNDIPYAIYKAVNHVKQFFPDVDRVTFEKRGFWTYATSTGECPDFEDYGIDYDILRDALDVVPVVDEPITYVLY